MKGRENWEVTCTCLSLSNSGHGKSLETELPSATCLLIPVSHSLLLSLHETHLPFASRASRPASYCCLFLWLPVLFISLSISFIAIADSAVSRHSCWTNSIKRACFTQSISVVKLRVTPVSLLIQYHATWIF